MIWIYVRIYTEECYLKWIKINVYNLYLCHLDFCICVFVHWISARVFSVTEGIESNLIPVITFVPRELFLHYAPLCEMRTKAQKCFLSWIFISTVDILCQRIQLINEPSDLLCLLWTIPALSHVWELHRQWLFSHCFLYHSHGHILSEMWVTNKPSEQSWKWDEAIVSDFSSWPQMPFKGHFCYRYSEIHICGISSGSVCRRACGKLAFPSHLAELGNWYLFCKHNC